MSVSVQAVAGAIRATDGILKSHKFAKSGRGIRSVGVYTQKMSDGQVIVDFWVGDWSRLYAERQHTDLDKAVKTLEARGYKVNGYEFGVDFKRSRLVVEVA